MRLKLFILFICVASNIKAQYIFKGTTEFSPKEEGANFLIDDVVALGINDSFILKSNSTGRITWYSNMQVKDFYQSNDGLYNTAHNNKYYVASSGDLKKGALEIFDLNDGTLLHTINNKNPISFKAVCFDKAGNLLYAIDDWGNLQVLDLNKMKIIHQKKIYNTTMWSLNISNNDSILYMGTSRSVLLYNVFSEKIIKEIKGFHSEVKCLIVPKDNGYFAIPDIDTIRVYDSDGNLFKAISAHDTIYSITYSSDGNILYFSPNAQLVEYCNYKQGGMVGIVQSNAESFLNSKNDEVLQISYPEPVKGKKLIYLSTIEGYLYIYELDSDGSVSK